MKPHYAFFGAAMLLAACGGTSDIDIGGGGGGGGNPVPENPTIDPGDLPVDGTETCGAFVCSGDVTNITFSAGALAGDPSDDSLILTGLPFDDDPLGAEFTYLTTVTGGNGIDYDIYENQETTPIPGFNRYLAIYKQTSGGEITVGVAAIEGYQEFGYSGAWYDVDDVTTSIPTLGLVGYTGDYAGTLTLDGSGALFLTDGTLRMEVDFTDSYLKGFIEDRDVYSVDGAGTLTNLARGPGTDRPTLVLNDTIITDGSFEGTVNSYNDDGSVLETGTYQGFFGGSDASVVGGLVRAIGDFDIDGDEDTDPNEDIFSARDLGVFTADCTLACP
jgi:hypothetical protein